MAALIIIFPLLFYLIQASKYGKGICHNSDKIRDVGDVYCCDNFEPVNHTCQECNKGFESSRGNRCKPCSISFYGTGCVEECKCTLLERCDNVNGCVNVSTTVNQDMYGYSTDRQYIDEQETLRNEVVTGSSIKPVLVYVIISALVTFIVTIAVLIMMYRKRRYKDRLTRHRGNNISRQNEQDISNEQYSTIL